MYELWGLRIDREYGWGGETVTPIEVRELLATFDSKELAEKYVQDSLLKAATKPYFYPDVSRGKYRYRAGSLLRDYESYEIELHVSDYPPLHNPVLEVK